ncbi:MAG: tetratricopeptide repeat protein [Cyanobacteria bacterium]|jgi:tetratricopeptide (TPR) repeat protein|nr:tetratricopeptide repeat protein [Cyanobacteria bacterium GSL.Bin1]
MSELDPNTTKIIALVTVSIILLLVGVTLGRSFLLSRRFEKACQLYEDEKYGDAIPIFKKIIERQKSNDLARLLLGKSFVGQGNLTEAISTFETLTQSSPKNVDAYIELGKVYMQQGKIDSAIAQFEQGAKIKPNRFAEPHRVLGLALKEKGETKAALASLEKAKKLYSAQKAYPMIEAIDEEIDTISEQSKK